MEHVTFRAPERMTEDLEKESKKIGMDSRSNFVRVVVEAGLKFIKKDGFESFISEASKKV